MINTQTAQNQSQFNNPDNRKLLYKHLTQYLNHNKNLTLDQAKSRAQAIIKKHSQNLFGKNSLSFWLGSVSIPFFCLYYLQDTFRVKENNDARELDTFHFNIWSELENLYIKDEYDKLLLICPRGASKTTTCDFALSVWAHCYKKSIYTLIAGNSEQDAIEFIRDARRAFEENPYIKNSFGELINTRKYTVNKLELELTNDTKIQAISSESSLRGKKFNGSRPTLIIADDYQSKKNVITQEARDKKFNTWVQDSQYAGDKAVFRKDKKVKMATKFIVLGTILHRDCFISRLSNDNSYKTLKYKAVLHDDVDELFNSGLWQQFKDIYFNSKLSDPTSEAKEFYYQNENEMQFNVLWRDKWDCLDLALDYYSNPQAFKQELQNDASKIGEKAFHQIKTLSQQELEQQKDDYTKTIMCIDPAVETGAKNDYTAICIGSKTSNNFRFIRKGTIDKLKFEDYISKVIKLLHEYEDITEIHIEKNVFRGVDANEVQKRINSDVMLKSRNITIFNETQTKNKEARIRAISHKVDSGFIIFNEEDEAFTNQLLDYEGEKYSLHDDSADVTAMFDERIDNEETIIHSLKFKPREWLF
ncbi:putative phage terminase large subunit-like protein [Desulfitispora alkaliphila]|uniref:hypothetical protein n=1 Tax=Desulfitispora alkaliphila TaxID=622674 RepID=UPI003D1B1138